MMHQTATDSFLVQSYLSTVLLFAGIYTLLYRVAPSHWTGVPEVCLCSSLSVLTQRPEGQK